MVRRFEALEKKLEQSGKGFHKASPWWLDTIRRFYGSGKKQLVIRKGRRAGGSSTLCRVAVLEALYGEHKVPAGDTGYVVFVSHTRKEATARLKTIAAILDALGFEYTHSDGTIEVPGRRVGFTVLTGSISGVSGWTAILIIGDEVSKWHNKETGANPATEVLASLRPTIATQPYAKIILSSSPMTESDAHAVAFAAGDTPFQMTARCSTWEGNPMVSEADTHGFEPNDRVWRREYLAEPQSELLDGFLSDVVDGCVDEKRIGVTTGLANAIGTGAICIGLDPAFRNDEFTCVVARSDVNDQGIPIVHVESVRGWRAKPNGPPLSATAIVENVSRLSRSLRAQYVFGDQKDAESLRALFAQHRVHYVPIPWTAASKLPRYTTLRALMNDRRVRLPNEPRTLSQLRSAGVKLLPSGIETIAFRGDDDRADALCLAVTEAIRRAPTGAKAIASVRRASASHAVGLGFGRTVEEHLRYDTGDPRGFCDGLFG
jgi:hypothetical protein